MVDLLRFRPAPVANLAARMPSGFPEAARGKSKPSRARVFERRSRRALEKFLRPLRPQGSSTSLGKPKERPGERAGAQEVWKHAQGMTGGQWQSSGSRIGKWATAKGCSVRRT
ncbi:hypothetical protein CJ240_04975 [Varibaculum cambriense]|uniref:Uncharacterized protein n=1 Tax=Varibaculum cambriense TaxID=184870 RepID=A0ABX4USG1_9ACTO|nr:hypothetical protein CJ240_04975 [Varibaculum cambriense]